MTTPKKKTVEPSVLQRVEGSIMEINSKRWSLTKLGILIFLYPSLTAVFIYDAFINARMDWVNASVFIAGLTTPRIFSQVISARFGNWKDSEAFASRPSEQRKTKKNNDTEEEPQ